MSSKIFKSTSISPITETKLLSSKKEMNRGFAGSADWSEIAEELVKNADQQAAAIIEQANKQMQVDKEKAEAELEKWKQLEQEALKLQLEEVKRQGFNEGYDKGLQQAHHDYSSKIVLAQEVLEKAYEEKKEIIKESEPFVIELCMQVASKIVKKELETNPDVLMHLIKQSLLYSNERSMISICVSPEDFEYVQQQRSQLLESLEGQVEVKILPEHSIEKGGCVIRTSYGSIDARVDVQLKEIKQALLTTIRDDSYEENARA